MKKSDKIYIAGHQGLVGKALIDALGKKGFLNLITRTREELDLTNQQQVERFFHDNKPDIVYLAAGKVGGVYANDTYRAEFIYENIMIQANIIHQSYLQEVKKLIFFACSSIFPKVTPQPVKEDYLLMGPLESTNEPFAIAKIAGHKMCESYNRQYGTDFISIIPTNLYGVGQRYELMNCLVIPALIRRFHEVKQANKRTITIWGTGRPSRDFLFAGDLADAAIFLTERSNGNNTYNVGTGRDYQISELANIICNVVGFRGKIIYDHTKPDGVLVKLQDVDKIEQLGWKCKVELKEGIRIAYKDFLERFSLNQII